MPGARRTPSQRLLLALGGAVVVVCLLGASTAGYVLVSWGRVERVKVHVAPVAPGQPMNILLVGSDSRAREGAAAAADVGGQRSDTIMVLRVDPRADHVTALSLPRDLWVPIAGTGGSARINSAYSAAGKQQVLIDTIRQDFGIPINHWIEVDFEGFRQLVDGIGGVTLYFPYQLRDRDAGFAMTRTGCAKLDGATALAYSRVRHVEYQTPDSRWHHDPLSDLSRIARQQVLMTEALKTAAGQARSNPVRLNQLLTIGTRNVSIDRGLGLDEVRDLANRFKGFDTSRFVTTTLPTTPRPANANTLLVDRRAAEPILNVFRGLDPGEVSPANIDVTVLNGTVAGAPTQERKGLAGDVSGALAKVGFQVGTPDDAPTLYPASTILYAPGDLNTAKGLARYLTGGVVLTESHDVAPGQVTLVAGLDFTTVHTDPTPLAQLPPAPGTPTTTAPPAGPAAPTTTAAPAAPVPVPVQTTTTLPSQIGAVPPGTWQPYGAARCRYEPYRAAAERLPAVRGA